MARRFTNRVLLAALFATIGTANAQDNTFTWGDGTNFWDYANGSVDFNNWNNNPLGSGAFLISSNAISNHTEIRKAIFSGTYLKAVGGLTLSGGGLNLSSTSTLNTIGGDLDVTGGYVNAAGAINVSGGLNLSSGSIYSADLTNGLTITGAFDWTGGAVGDTVTPKATIVNALGGGNLSGGTLNLAGTLVNSGAMTWTSGGLYGATGGSFDNFLVNKGTFEIRNDGSNWTNASVTNSGTFLKDTTTGLSTLSGNSFANNATGVLEVQTGELDLTHKVFSNAGQVNVDSGATLRILPVTSATNSGTITAKTGASGGSTLELGGAFTNTNVIAVNGLSQIIVSGNLQNQATMQATGGGVIDVTGSLTLAGGKIIGATVQNSSKLAFDGNYYNTLDGVVLSDATLNGGLDLSAGNWDSIRIQNGTLFGANTKLLLGSTTGNYYNGGSYLRVNQDETFTGATLTFGTNYYLNYIYGENGHNVTFDSGTTATGRWAIDSYNAGGTLTNQGSFTATGGSGYGAEFGNNFAHVINQGTITENGFGAAVNLYGGTFDNQATGVITANGSTVNGSWTAATNEGTMQATNGGQFNIGSVDNTGGHIVATGAGSKVLLNGTYTTATLGDVHAATNGVVALSGTLNNSGSTFDPIPLSGTGTFLLAGGTISGGNVTDSSKLGFDSNYNNSLSGVTLSDPTLHGGLDLSTPGTTQSIRVQGGTSYGSNPIFLIGATSGYYYNGSSVLRENQDETFTSATLTFGTNYYLNYIYAENGHNITLDPGTTATGRWAIDSYNGGGTLLNQGSLTATGGSGYGAEIGYNFAHVINQGTITENSFGAAVNLYGTNFDNQAGGVITANGSTVNGSWTAATNEGTMQAINGSLFNLASIDNTSGHVIATGAGSRVNLTGTFTTPTLGDMHAASGGEISLSGTLNNTGATFDSAPIAGTGTFMMTGGTISGGTVTDSSKLGFDSSYYNTLNGVTLSDPTLHGGLDLSTPGTTQSMRVQGGTSYGSNPIFLIGATSGNYYNGSSVLRENQDETFTSATLTFGTNYYLNYIYAENGHNITLDPGTTATGRWAIDSYNGGGILLNQGSLTATGGSGYGAEIGYNFTHVINQGTITENSFGASVNLYGANFDNQAGGVITANGSTVNGSWTAATNEGTMQAVNGGLFNLGSLNNTSGHVIATGAGSRVNLTGTFTTPTLGDMHAASGGEISLSGTLNNTGATFDTLPIAGTGTFMVTGGTISGGTVTDSSKLGFDANYYNTLNGVTLSDPTLNGGLDLSTPGTTQSMRLQGGTSFGTNPIFLIGATSGYYYNGSSDLRVNQDMTFTGATLTFGTNYYLNYIYAENGHNITFDSGTTATGRWAIDSYNGGGTLTNQGTLTATGGSGYGAEIGYQFAHVINQGSITENSFGAAVNLYGGTFDNQASGVVTANGSTVSSYWAGATNEGTFQAVNGGLFNIGSVDNTNGHITATGAGSRSNLTGTYVTAQLGDTHAVSGGEISLAGTLNNTSAILDALPIAGTGSFMLTGGTISGGTVTDSSKLSFDSNYSNTLNNVVLTDPTLNGGLDLSTPGITTSVRLQGGTSFSSGATFLLGATTGYYYNGSSNLRLNQDTTFTGAKLTFGTNYYLNYLYAENGHNLTLDSSTTATGRWGIDAYNTGGTLTNQGTLTASGGNGYGVEMGYNFATVNNQGTVNEKNFASGLNFYGTTFNNSGTINVDASAAGDHAGAFNNSGNLNILNGSTFYVYSPFHQSAGTTNLTGGSTFYANQDVHIDGGVLSGTGTVQANVYNSGTISAGASGVGNLAIQGNLIDASGAQLGVNILDSTHLSQLTVSGNAFFAGTINLDFLNGYVPTIGSTFEVAKYGTSNYDPLTLTVNSNYSGLSYVLEDQTAGLFVLVEGAAGFSYWLGGPAGGDWSDATKWSNSTLPSPTADVINPNNNPLTHSHNADTIHSFLSQGQFELSGGSLTGTAADSSFKVNNTFTLDGGTLASFILNAGSGGQGVSVTGTGSDLLNDTINTNISLTAGSHLKIDGGVINAPNFTITGDPAQHVNGGTVELANGVSLAAGVSFQVDPANLTIDPGVDFAIAAGNTFTMTGGVLTNQGTIDAAGGVVTLNPDSFVNSGITKTTGSNMSIGGASLTNSGTIEALGGQTLNITSTALTNSSLLLAADSHLNLFANNAYVNTGTIKADGASAVVQLAGTMLSDGIGSGFSATNGGEIQLTGAMNNTAASNPSKGGVLDIGGTSGGAFRLTGGSITGGTILHPELLRFTSDNNGGYNNLLNGVTLQGNLDLTQDYGSSVRFEGGTLATGKVIMGNESNIVFDTNSSYSGELYLNDLVNQPANNDIHIDKGATFTLTGTGAIDGIGYLHIGAVWQYGPNGTFINQGTVGRTGAGTWQILSGDLQNTGLIETNGGSLYDYASTFENAGTVEVTGGGYLELNNAVTSNAGTQLIATGAGSVLKLNGTYANGLGAIADWAGAQVQLAGSDTNTVLNLNNVDAASMFALSGGQINGGSIVDSLNLSATGDGTNNRLNGVTVDQGLNMNPYNTDIRILNGITVTSGAIQIGQESNLIFDGSQTFEGHIQFTSGGQDHVNFDGNSTTLTLGPDAVIDGVGNADLFQRYSYGSNSTILNKGTINMSDSAHSWSVYGDVLQNAVGGQIEATNGGTLYLRSGSIQNSGTISAFDGSVIGLAPGWGSDGYTTAQLGSMVATNGSTIALYRSLNNAGANLNLSSIDATSGFQLNSAEIDGGFITNSLALRATGDGTNNILNGVQLGNGLDLNAYNSDVRFKGGVGLNAGNVQIGHESNLIFDGTQTFDSGIQFTSSGWAHLNVDGTNTVFTLGPDSSVSGTGYADLFNSYSGGTNRTIINYSTINATDPASYWILYGDNLFNQTGGVIEATGGGSLYLSSNNYTNVWNLGADGAGSNLYLRNAGSNEGNLTATNGGTVHIQGTLDGTGGTFTTSNGGTLLIDGGVLQNAFVSNSAGLAATWNYANVLRDVTVGAGLNFQNTEFTRIQTGSGPTGEGLKGDINLSGNNAAVVFDGDQTYNSEVSITGGGNYLGAEGGTHLILGPSSDIVGAGSVSIGSYWNSNTPNSVVNQGWIHAQNGANWSEGSTTFANSGTLQIDNGATLNVPTATYEQTAGQTILNGHFFGSAQIDAGLLTGTGTISGSLTNSGVLQPDAFNVGSLTIGGSFTDTAAGVVDLNVNGTAAGDYGQLLIGGNATFGGTLDVSFVGGFTPNFGQSFELAKYGAGDWTGGTFGTVIGSDGGFSYTLQYDSTGMFLIVSGAPGYAYWQGVNSVGNWNDAGSWSTGTVPDGTLNAANLTNNGILHDSGTNSVKSFFSAGALELQGGSITGSTAASTWTVSNTFLLDGGTLSNFIVQPGVSGQGVTVTGTGSTLLNDTILTSIDLTNGGSLTINGGALSGTANIDHGGTIGLADSVTLAGSTFSFGANGTNRLSAEGNALEDLNGVTFSGNHVNLTSNVLTSGTGGFRNDQILFATGAGSVLNITPDTFDDHGTVEALSGATVTVDATTYGNLGNVVSDGSGSVLNFNGGVVSSSTGHLLASNGGVLNFGAVLDLGGTNFDAATLSSGGGQFILDGGVIANGHLANAGSLIFPAANPGALDNIDLTNGLNLGANQTLHIFGTFSVSGGQVNMGSGSKLEFGNATTLENAVINFAPYGTSGFLIDPGQTLSLGGGLILTGNGFVQSNVGTLSLDSALSLTNASLAVDPTNVVIPVGGGLVANGGGSFSMVGGTFTNYANNPNSNPINAVVARSGGSIDLAPTDFYNYGTIQSETLSNINLHPTNWDQIGNLNAVGSQANIHLGGGTINLATENGVLFAVNGGQFFLNTTLDITNQHFNPDAIGGAFIVDGGTIYSDTGAQRGWLTTGTPDLIFTNNQNNVLWNVQFEKPNGLAMHGGFVDIRGDVLNYTGLWQLDTGAEIDFEASRDFQHQTFALNGGTWKNVADTTGQDSQGAHPESTISYNTTFSGTAGNIYVDKLHNYANFVAPTGGTWNLNSSEDWVNEYNSVPNSPGFNSYGQMNADGGTMNANFNRFANNGVVESEAGGWMDVTAQVWDRVGNVQATGAGSTTVLRGGTVVIGANDTLAAYLGGVIRLGTTLDNTSNFLNPGDITNTYVNGPFTVGYNGDYYHGSFWGTVLGGMIDSMSYDIRFENANLQDTTLTLADHATLAGLNLNNEHVHVLGTLASNLQFNLSNYSTLLFDGNREFDNGAGTPSALTFTGYGNTYGMLGNGNLTLGAGTSLTGNAGSEYTVSMGNGLLDIQQGVSVTGPNVYFQGGTVQVENGVNLDSTGTAAAPSSWHYNDNEIDNFGTIHTGAFGTTNLSTPILNNQGVIRTDAGGTSWTNGTNWINNGSVQVDGAASTSYLAGNITNDAFSSLNGQLQATNGGVFQLGFGTYQPVGNVTNATANSILDTSLIGGSFHFNNGWLHGGQLNSVASNLVFNNNFSDYPGWDDNLLDNVHLVDPATHAAAGLDLTNGGSVSIENEAQDWSNWQFQLDKGGRLTFLTDTELPAVTQVNFNSNGIINPYNSTMTIDAGVSFTGLNATIGEYYAWKDPHNKIINHDNIVASSGGTWNIAPFELFNDGNIGVTNGSKLYLTPTVWDKLGTVSANGAGSVLFLGDPTRGGTIQLSQNDTFSFTNGGTIQLGSMLINHFMVGGNPVNGVIDATGNGFFKIAGGGIQGGTLVIDTPTNPNTLPPIDPNLQPLEFVPGYTNTLDGVTLQALGGGLASLDLRNGSSVNILNSLTSSNGFWLDKGAQLTFAGDRNFSAGALGNGFFHFGHDTSVWPYYDGGDLYVGGMLTLGAGSTATGGDVRIHAGSMEVADGGAITGDAITIATSGAFNLDGGMLAPSGAVANSYLNVNVGSLVNDGTIESFNGSTTDVNATNWTTVGHISAIGAGSVTYLDGGLIAPDWSIHPITAAGGGSFILRTTLDDTAGGPNGQFFDPALIGGKFTIQGGTLLNGRVNSTSADLRVFNATYDGVTLTDGTGVALAGLSLDSGESLTIKNFFNSNNQFDLTGSSVLQFAGDRMFGAGANFTIDHSQLNELNGGTLTFNGGTGVVGPSAWIGNSWWVGANTGNLAIGAGETVGPVQAGDVWAITPANLNNQGTLAATGGSRLYLTVQNWTTPGALFAGANSSIVLDGGTIVNNPLQLNLADAATGKFELRTELNNIGEFLNPGAVGPNAIGGIFQVGGSDFNWVPESYAWTKSGYILGGKIDSATPDLVFTAEPLDTRYSTGWDNVLDGVTLSDSTGLFNPYDATTFGHAAGLNLNNGGTVRIANDFFSNDIFNLDNHARITFSNDQTLGTANNNASQFIFGASGGGEIYMWDHTTLDILPGSSFAGPVFTISGDTASRFAVDTGMDSNGVGSDWTLSTDVVDVKKHIGSTNGGILDFGGRSDAQTVLVRAGGEIAAQGAGSAVRFNDSNITIQGNDAIRNLPSAILGIGGGGSLSMTNGSVLTNEGKFFVNNSQFTMNGSTFMDAAQSSFTGSDLNLVNSHIFETNPASWTMNSLNMDGTDIHGAGPSQLLGIELPNSPTFSSSRNNLLEFVNLTIDPPNPNPGNLNFGALNLSNGGFLRVRSSTLNVSSIELGTHGILDFDGNAAVNAGIVTFDGGGASSDLAMEAGSTLVLANGTTLVGNIGSLGGQLPGSAPNPAPRVLQNNGAIIVQNEAADAAASIDATSFKNTGKVQVDAGNTLNVTGAFLNSNNGVVDVGGTINMTGGNQMQFDGGTLTGFGTVNASHGIVVNGTTIHAGGSPGHMVLGGDLTMDNTSTMLVDIGGYQQGPAVEGAPGYSFLEVHGNANVSGKLDIESWFGFVPTMNYDFTFLTTTGSINGAFSAVDFSGFNIQPGGSFTIVTTNNSISLDYKAAAATPEPGSFLALGGGLGLLLVNRKRKQKKAVRETVTR